MFLLFFAETSTASSSNKQVFKNLEGTIASPNYPKEYGNNERQYYKIIAPMRSEIVLIFNTFDVELHASCDYDYLDVSSFHLDHANIVGNSVLSWVLHYPTLQNSI